MFPVLLNLFLADSQRCRGDDYVWQFHVGQGKGGMPDHPQSGLVFACFRRCRQYVNPCQRGNLGINDARVETRNTRSDGDVWMEYA